MSSVWGLPRKPRGSGGGERALPTELKATPRESGPRMGRDFDLGNLHWQPKSPEHSPAWLVGAQCGRALKALKARTLSWETIKTRTKLSARRYSVQFCFLITKFKNNLKIQDQGIIKHITGTGIPWNTAELPECASHVHTHPRCQLHNPRAC